MIFSWRGKFYGHAMPFVLCGEGGDQSDYGCKDFYNTMGMADSSRCGHVVN